MTRNDRLRQSMLEAGLSYHDLAESCEVDPKTVERWVTHGREPHRRTKVLVAQVLDRRSHWLWPSDTPQDTAGDVVETLSYRSDLAPKAWWDLISATTANMDLLGFTLYFLALNHPHLVDELQAKAAAGCKIRAIVADPTSSHVRQRDEEEGEPITLVHRIHTTLKHFAPLQGHDGFEMRYQDLPLYNSIFRFDTEMLVTPHLHATPGASAPLLHLRRQGPRGLFDRFNEHFDSVWATTTPIPESDWPQHGTH